MHPFPARTATIRNPFIVALRTDEAEAVRRLRPDARALLSRDMQAFVRDWLFKNAPTTAKQTLEEDADA